MSNTKDDNEKDVKLINKSRMQNDFLVVANKGFIRDTRLSLKEKGILTLLLTNNADWVIHLSEVVHHSSDGITSLASGFKRLIDLKYMKKEITRNDKGHFNGTTYYIYDRPYDGSEIILYSRPDQKKSTEEELNSDNPEQETPNAEIPVSDSPNCEPPDADCPKTANGIITNINFKEKESKQTNLEHPASEEVEEVSVSEIIKSLKELFDGKYPFPDNFDKDVLALIRESNIDDDNRESYLRYVFERAKQEKVKKSFVGLYYTMALSDSVVTDFKNSNFINKNAEKKNEPVIEYITCPICGSQVAKYGNECPTCRTEVRVLQNHESDEFIVARKVWSMSPEKKDAFEQARSDYEISVKAKTGRTFVTSGEYHEFWRDYGLLDQEETNE